MLTPAERFLKRKGPPVMSRGEDGYNEITHEYLVKLCEWNDQYSLPELNEQLYLNYKGKQSDQV